MRIEFAYLYARNIYAFCNTMSLNCISLKVLTLEKWVYILQKCLGKVFDFICDIFIKFWLSKNRRFQEYHVYYQKNCSKTKNKTFSEFTNSSFVRSIRFLNVIISYTNLRCFWPSFCHVSGIISLVLSRDVCAFKIRT